MRRSLMILLTALLATLGAAGAAQAVVVNDQGTVAGVALVPGTSLPKGVTDGTTSVSKCDPFLTPDLQLLSSVGLCDHGGPVIHANETFALTWDPNRLSWTDTRNYVEQFLKDVAEGSNTSTSPYAVTTQYQDSSGRAQNTSKYGGACIDLGDPGGYTCQFGDTTGAGVGANYPSSPSCTVTGDSTCLTDADIKSELSTHLQRTSLLTGVSSGYSPLLVVLLPQGVDVCLNSAGDMCSANSSSAAAFCSYHSFVDYQGTDVPYVVQPWTAGTGCDRGVVSASNSQDQIPIDDGAKLVVPLSESEMAAIVNPDLNGWYAAAGTTSPAWEIDDNGGCGVPILPDTDKAIVGSSAQNPYKLPPAFNNGGVIDTDPSVPQCALGVALQPRFIVPSAVNPGDLVQFDGSITNSTLIVPKLQYAWNYGDGTFAYGPSVEHTYAHGGNYTVTLAVKDRGGNTATLSQTVVVSGAVGTGPSPAVNGLHARLSLMPQSLTSALRNGVAMAVTTTATADGIATVSISRAAANRAHIKHGAGSTVVIGRGTVAGLKAGTVQLRLRLPSAIATHLLHLRHLTLTVRLALVGAGGTHVAVDVAGQY
ncbi:MAG TPA: PKD domain-containing protein [Solirubrobacteraceae bacterium]|nr:PKD domain-containing protein [Solirubrobacteraceae bacterium]